MLDRLLAELVEHPKAKVLNVRHGSVPTPAQAIAGEPAFAQTVITVQLVIAE